MENKYRDLIISIQGWLNNFSADNIDSMTHKCWNELGHIGLSIDHDLKELDKKNEN